jgi:hypothetical protein
MANTTFDEELDLVPGFKYLKDKLSAVTVTAAPKSFDNAPGIVTPKVDLERLDPALRERIDIAARDWIANKELNPKGEPLPITSGFRDFSKQSQLFANRASNPNLVAPPGYSSHEKGMGIDILPGVPDSFLANYGLYRPYGAKDPVHVEINPKANWQSPVNLTDDEGLGIPGFKYTSRQGVYEPSIRESVNNQFQDAKSQLGSSKYYTNTFPKQVAALGDVLYGSIPAAVKFVGEPFAKLIDKVGDTKVATEALDKITQFAERPIGKAFGITNDPAYNSEAANRFMDYVGKNMDKGADYIAKETGMNKSDVTWFMNAATIGAGAVAYKGGKKAIETGAEVLPKAKEQIQTQFQNVKGKVEEKFPSLKGEENPNLRSVGAAELSAGQLRQAKARELLVPMDLPRDIVTRNFQDINWAREKAKDAITGEPLRQNYSKLNKELIDNLDAEIYQTGAQKTGVDRGDLGQDLVTVTNNYKNLRKQEKDAAYTAADVAGETLQQVPYKPILDYIENIKTKRPTQYDQNPILKMVEEDLKANDIDKVGSVNLRQLEDVRALINAETEFGTSNGFHGSKIRNEIDNITKDAGGTLYKEARALNNRYMKEFEENPAISNITAIKKGTTERRVPIETLVEDSMLKGPKSRVEEIFKTLEKAGPEGQAMINELRGVVAEQIKNEAIKGVSRDINGNPIVTPTGLNNMITKLDKSGKLDLIFGKKGAERYRTLNDVAIDVKTVPEGSVNYSGSAAQFKNLAAQIATDVATSAIAGVPAPVTTVGTLLYKNRKNKQELNKISEFINYGKEQK